MAKRPSLTETLAEAAFYQAWFANTPESDQDTEVYQRNPERYLNRFSKLPSLALKTIDRASAAEANRSIEAYERLRPIPEKRTERRGVKRNFRCPGASGGG